MEKFKLSKTPIEGIVRIETHPFLDERGFFMECYNLDEFKKIGFNEVFVQDNHSKSKKGVMRGLHFQNNPSPMGKLVRVIEGEIFDVGVDIRKGSPTFGQWYAEILSAENNKMLYFPPGFAHGFLALKDNTHVHYKCTGTYSQPDESAIAWNDPEVNIKWPIEKLGETKIIVSQRDQVHPNLKEANINHTY